MAKSKTNKTELQKQISGFPQQLTREEKISEIVKGYPAEYSEDSLAGENVNQIFYSLFGVDVKEAVGE